MLCGVEKMVADYRPMLGGERFLTDKEVTFGFNHYVPMGKPLLMVEHGKQNVPEWMRSDVFDRTIKPFSTDTFSEPQVTKVVTEGIELLVSTPEQAFWECLLLAPRQYSYMDLFYIMEQLTTLRPEVVQQLLETTKNLRIKRMFLVYGRKGRVLLA